MVHLPYGQFLGLIKLLKWLLKTGVGDKRIFVFIVSTKKNREIKKMSENWKKNVKCGQRLLLKGLKNTKPSRFGGVCEWTFWHENLI